MADQYTHHFKFEIDDWFMRGKTEFNTDGKASFKMQEWSEPLPDYVLDYFKKLTDLMKEITHSTTEGSVIKKVEIKLEGGK